MKRLYHSAAFDPSLPVGSYWEESAPPLPVETPKLVSDTTCEVAVIGAGFTGLSAALHLARDHGVDVRVLDMGEPGWAASGRNGGFCCLGGTKASHETLAKRHGVDEARRFARAQLAAIDLVRDLMHSEDIDVDAFGEGEYEVAHTPRHVDGLRAEIDRMKAIYGLEPRIVPKEDLRQAGTAMGGAEAALFVPVGFGLHPMKYVRGLCAAAVRRGARVHGHSAVTGWKKADGWHHLTTPGGTVRAKTVIVATNGYTPEGLHPGMDGRALPALTNIITTRPLTEAEREAQGWTTPVPAYDSRILLHYFRLLPDGRFLLGARGGLDAGPESVAAMKAHMIGRLQAMFPDWGDVGISHFWRGFVCLAADLVPHVARMPDDGSVIQALAYHGNGVSIGTWSGRAAAQLAARAAPDTEIVPAVAGQPMPKFPLPGLRTLYLRGAYATYWLKDELL